MGTLYVVRHGQASFHEEDYDKLSALGEEQCRLLGEHWAREGVLFDKVYSGPLRRQVRSAEIAGEAYQASGLPWPGIEIMKDLSEMPVEQIGKLFMPRLCVEDARMMAVIQQFTESTDRDERERLFIEAFEKVVLKWATGEYQDDSVETWDSFMRRIEACLNAMTGAELNGKRVAAFTSGGPTAVSIHLAGEATLEGLLALVWQVLNSAITEFTFGAGRLSLHAFNLVPHLSDPALQTYR